MGSTSARISALEPSTETSAAARRPASRIGTAMLVTSSKDSLLETANPRRRTSASWRPSHPGYGRRGSPAAGTRRRVWPGRPRVRETPTCMAQEPDIVTVLETLENSDVRAVGNSEVDPRARWFEPAWSGSAARHGAGCCGPGRADPARTGAAPGDSASLGVLLGDPLAAQSREQAVCGAPGDTQLAGDVTDLQPSPSTAKHSRTSRAVEMDLRPSSEGVPGPRRERRGVVLHQAGSK